jgi:hypothetical protein
MYDYSPYNAIADVFLYNSDNDCHSVGKLVYRLFLTIWIA